MIALKIIWTVLFVICWVFHGYKFNEDVLKGSVSFFCFFCSPSIIMFQFGSVFLVAGFIEHYSFSMLLRVVLVGLFQLSNLGIIVYIGNSFKFLEQTLDEEYGE